MVYLPGMPGDLLSGLLAVCGGEAFDELQGTTMTDKEVGELWLSFVLGRGQQTYAHNQRYKDIAAMLIRKLVEERHSRSLKTLSTVLKEFGIPEESWPNG